MKPQIDCNVIAMYDSESIWKVIDYLITIHDLELLEKTKNQLKRNVKLNIPFCINRDSFKRWHEDNRTYIMMIGGRII